MFFAQLVVEAPCWIAAHCLRRHQERVLLIQRIGEIADVAFRSRRLTNISEQLRDQWIRRRNLPVSRRELKQIHRLNTAARAVTEDPVLRVRMKDGPVATSRAR